MPVTDSSFFIALAWERKGKFEIARQAYLKCLEHHPEHLKALKNLGNLLVKLGSVKEAIGYYEKALELDPQDQVLAFNSQYLKKLLIQTPSHVDQQNFSNNQHNRLYIPENPLGRINCYRQKTFSNHRSGWSYALNALKPLHNSQGILLDGFIENNFAWKYVDESRRSDDVLQKMKIEGTFSSLATSEEKGIVPYKEPWVGFLHNPQNMPKWFHYQESPQSIFSKTIWQESLEHCTGLFTFSEYHAQWLRQETGLPVSCLIHPTEIPDLQFDFERFIKNPYKKIIQVGWWLRKIQSIYLLPIHKNNPHGYEKIRLVPKFFHNADAYLETLMEKEREHANVTVDSTDILSTRKISHVPDQDYDEFLSKNIVFIELYDANANNAVVECIARTTPLLINPLPAVKEYLGNEYPLYYDTLEEAAEKALDLPLIFKTHQYLKSLETRNRLDGKRFLESFQSSEVYQLLEKVPLGK